jgi:hypothetical protein
MAHYKSYLRYNAYKAYNGLFPANFVICVYKGFGFNKKVFDEIKEEREAARKRDIINKFKWINLTNGE